MVLTAEEVKQRYPLHWMVWNDDYEQLKGHLQENTVSTEELERRDPRGRTPLLLAVTLGLTDCVQVLVDAGADVNCEKDGWTVVQEATSVGDPSILRMVLSKRDYLRHAVRAGGIPELLNKLSLAPDFYVEMKWEFTSWVPLVSRMCPFDTYKVYKRGANVRVDTTLVGFENNHWQRGDRTYIFRGQGATATLTELDHELGTMWSETLEPAPGRAWPPPAPAALAARLAQPIALNYLDTDKISFESFSDTVILRETRPRVFVGANATLTELDHELGTMWSETLEPAPGRAWPPPAPAALAARLAQPIALNYLDTDKISFESFSDTVILRETRPRVFVGANATLTELDHELGTMWSETLEPAPGRAWPPPAPAALAARLAQPIALNYLDTDKISFESFSDTVILRETRPRVFVGANATLTELDHELGTMWSETLEPAPGRAWPPPAPAALAARLAQPIALNYLDTDKISFERNKSGIWGWRQDKLEVVNTYDCKVFSANNVELVSKTRTEHLSKADKSKLASPKAPLAGLLALADRDSGATTPTTPDGVSEEDIATRVTSSKSREEVAVTWQEYFSDEPLERDIGKPKEITTKVQKFKATLWLCENYPLELQEQIMPILDLMASMSSPHFAKLKDFIQMQLPAGFPVKIEIPLFHVLNARITFGNIFATETPVPHVECIQEGERLACVVDDACFNRAEGYRDALASDERIACNMDNDESLLQYAIQQSLMDPGTHEDQVDVWEALRGARTSPAPSPRPRSPHAHSAHAHAGLLAHEERQLQKAIEASLATLTVAAPALPAPSDLALREALEQSAKEQARRRAELEAEQRELDEALRRSLLEH